MVAPHPRWRLADHALVRRHVVDGEELFIVHDARGDGLVRLGAREHALIASADGTRDLDGILLAAAARGAHVRREMAADFFAELARVGLVHEHLDGDAEGESVAESPASRRVRSLPRFLLRCDGRGSCCRLYATVLMSPAEEARARAHCPTVQDAADRPGRGFVPAEGVRDDRGVAATLVDGRCAYLAEDLGCLIHRAGGGLAKPAGCRLFPATFVDDGAEVRVSAAVECACVLESVGGHDGEPLVAERVTVRADLEPAAVVDLLPLALTLAATGARAPTASVCRWLDALADVTHLLVDVPGRLAALATHVERCGVEPPNEGWEAWAKVASSEDAVALRAWLVPLVARLERRIRDDAAWRSERDLARQAVSWMGEAARALIEPESFVAAAAAPSSVSERFYVHALVFGRGMSPACPLSASLRDRAVRVLLARRMAEAVPAPLRSDPASKHPLALVDALMRGHGLAAYVADVLGDGPES